VPLSSIHLVYALENSNRTGAAMNVDVLLGTDPVSSYLPLHASVENAIMHETEDIPLVNNFVISYNNVPQTLTDQINIVRHDISANIDIVPRNKIVPLTATKYEFALIKLPIFNRAFDVDYTFNSNIPYDISSVTNLVNYCDSVMKFNMYTHKFDRLILLINTTINNINKSDIINPRMGEIVANTSQYFILQHSTDITNISTNSFVYTPYDITLPIFYEHLIPNIATILDHFSSIKYNGLIHRKDMMSRFAMLVLLNMIKSEKQPLGARFNFGDHVVTFIVIEQFLRWANETYRNTYLNDALTQCAKILQKYVRLEQKIICVYGSWMLKVFLLLLSAWTVVDKNVMC
jgi:hypothetical protein